MRIATVVLLASTVAAPAAWAQAGPSFDCSKASTAIETGGWQPRQQEIAVGAVAVDMAVELLTTVEGGDRRMLAECRNGDEEVL